MIDNNSESSRFSRRTVLKFAAVGSGYELAAIRTGAGRQSSGFTDILSIDPSNYPNVLLNIRVDTAAGRNGELTQNDFTIVENDAEQAINSFEYASTSADIVFVFDDTGSMSDEINAMKSGVTDLTEMIEERGIDTRYALISFKDDVETDRKFTENPEELKNAVDSLFADGGDDDPEDNFDAIKTGLDLGFRSDAQKVVIDITDSISHYRGDTSGHSKYTLDEIATELTTTGVTYIAVAPDIDDPKTSKKTLADKTGGLWIDIASADFSAILDEITEVVVTAYILEYLTDTPPGESKDIGVTVTDPKKGEDQDTGELVVPEDVVVEDISRLQEISNRKIELAKKIDENSETDLNDEESVEEIIENMKNKAMGGTIPPSVAEEAINRMKLAEEVTDQTLTAIGKDGYDLARLEAEALYKIATSMTFDTFGLSSLTSQIEKGSPEDQLNVLTQAPHVGLFDNGLNIRFNGINTLIDLNNKNPVQKVEEESKNLVVNNEEVKTTVTNVAEDVYKKLKNKEISTQDEVRNAIDKSLQPAIKDKARYNHRVLEQMGGKIHLHDDSFYVHEASRGGWLGSVDETLKTLHNQLEPGTIQDLDGELLGKYEAAEKAREEGINEANSIAKSAKRTITTSMTEGNQLGDVRKSTVDLIQVFTDEEKSQSQLETALDFVSIASGGAVGKLTPLFQGYATFTGGQSIIDIGLNHTTTVARIILGDSNAELNKEGSKID